MGIIRRILGSILGDDRSGGTTENQRGGQTTPPTDIEVAEGRRMSDAELAEIGRSLKEGDEIIIDDHYRATVTQVESVDEQYSCVITIDDDPDDAWMLSVSRLDIDDTDRPPVQWMNPMEDDPEWWPIRRLSITETDDAATTDGDSDTSTVESR